MLFVVFLKPVCSGQGFYLQFKSMRSGVKKNNYLVKRVFFLVKTLL